MPLGRLKSRVFSSDGGSAVSFREVRASYGAGAQRLAVLQDLSLEISPSSFVCLLGKTGCGKSTLLKMVLGELHPELGEVIVDGKAITGPGRHCGFVPQKYSLFPDRRVLDNVTFGPLTMELSPFSALSAGGRARKREIRAGAAALLLRMGLSPADGSKFPHELSGGMQQRVAIAQALSTNPNLLLMDEAFSALDGATRTSMQELLREIWLERRPTILFVTHNVQESLLLGSRIVVLARDPSGAGHQPAGIALDVDCPWTRETPVADRRHSRDFKELHALLEAATRGEHVSASNRAAVAG